MIAVIDFETTGLKAGIDEILQVSIIDENYNTLYNTYCKPLRHTTWKEAQKINGITPKMVTSKPPFILCRDKVKEILTEADEIIAYNTVFEDGFLKAYGIEVDAKKWIDPMLIFTDIYKEPHPHGGYKWQSLTTCARYYGYEFKSHDSLEDEKETLYCYKKMCENKYRELQREAVNRGK